MKRFTEKVVRVLASRWFLYATLGFFVFEALWFVFSAMYPMAFDEEVHLGIIDVYAQQWSPFLASQPVAADSFGALTSDPSYLFHYLMSFPYRFIGLFTDNLTTQVILLRLVNVGIFTGALLLFRRVVLKAGTSPALANVLLAGVALIPIAPMLAAHINYDNLLTLLVAWLCWLVLGIMQRLKQHEVPVARLGLLLVVCLLTPLVKYAALPIVLATGLFVIVYAWRCFRGHGKQFGPALKRNARALPGIAKFGLIVAVLVGSVLFAQRYGLNLYRYHTPVPECDAVLNVDRCQAYSPWRRNYRMANEKSQFDHSLWKYTRTWQHDMRRRLLFAVNGPHHGYASRPPLPVVHATVWVLSFASLILLIVYWRRIFRGRPELAFFATIIGGYVLVLWLNGYADYLYTGGPVAINGRYLLPIIVLMGAVLGRAFSVALGKRLVLKAWLTVGVFALLLQGGGLATFILRSDATWDWPNSFVVDANDAARTVLKPLIIEGSQ
jgi:hypothetical protein